MDEPDEDEVEVEEDKLVAAAPEDEGAEELRNRVAGNGIGTRTERCEREALRESIKTTAGGSSGWQEKGKKAGNSADLGSSRRRGDTGLKQRGGDTSSEGTSRGGDEGLGNTMRGRGGGRKKEGASKAERELDRHS